MQTDEKNLDLMLRRTAAAPALLRKIRAKLRTRRLEPGRFEMGAGKFVWNYALPPHEIQIEFDPSAESSILVAVNFFHRQSDGAAVIWKSPSKKDRGLWTFYSVNLLAPEIDAIVCEAAKLLGLDPHGASSANARYANEPKALDLMAEVSELIYRHRQRDRRITRRHVIL